MQEPSMQLNFVRQRNGKRTRQGDDGTAAGLISLPAELLQRHGALVLNPEDAVTIPGQKKVPRSTVYRARTLLVPGEIIMDTPTVRSINDVLRRVGMQLKTPSVQTDAELMQVNQRAARAVLRLPRVAVLVPVHRHDELVHPQVVDAWVALQALRAAAMQQTTPTRGGGKGTPARGGAKGTPARGGAKAAEEPLSQEKPTEHMLSQETVDQISLEHLLIGSAIFGSPAYGGTGVAGNSGDSSGVTGPGITDSYLFSGGDSRIPVAVCLDAPKRLDAEGCTKAYGRRPVVAVLDTGVRAHPWLNVTKNGNGYILPPDGFVGIDTAIQDAIRTQGSDASTGGDQPRQVIRNAWDKPVTADSLVGELDTDTGHSTFISGIVRQVAADARVLAVRIMHSDGLVNEGDLLCALGMLIKRVALAQAGEMDKMVDVVSLSLGYFSESGDSALNSGLQAAIGELLSLGVVVVAAAGNFASSRRFYPAAFAEPAGPGQVPLVSVGALNPNGTEAIFSDGGGWITAWASGAIIISTFPTDIQGGRSPEIRVGKREALDPDDYHGGWAAWSGTSFSAPLLAAHVARRLLAAGALQKELQEALQEDKHDPELELHLPGDQPAKRRARAALKSLGWKG
jgi:subtilisin family serine protease